MTPKNNVRVASKAACLLLAPLFLCVVAVHAVEPVVPQSVEVYWKASRTIAATGVSSVIVLDDEIAHATLGNDTIELVGLSRGDTVALAYVNGNPVSILIHVVPRPIKAIPPSLLRRE